MPIQFCCTHCHQPIEVDSEHAGRTAVCPYCRHTVAVPWESTYQPETAVAARPAASMEPPVEVQYRQTPIPPPRLRAGYTFGTYALICTGLALVLFGVGAAGSAALYIREFGNPAAGPTATPDLQRLQELVARHAWIPALEFGGLLFGLAGLALGIVSLTQARTNWRGLTAVIVCALFLTCVCSATAVAALGGVGVPAGPV